jgi:hypothetical protein
MFPVDVVYTWVENTDPAFKEQCADHWERYCKQRGWNRTLSYRTLFSDNSELKFSLRSLEKYAPWVRHIYIVTNGQVPSWLVDHPKVSIVCHEEIIPKEYLPTFSSMNIEMYIHNIPGLSENFLSLNDDFFLGACTTPLTFFTEDGRAKNFFSSDWIGRDVTKPGANYLHAWKYSNELLNTVFAPCSRRLPLHQIRPMEKRTCQEISLQYKKEIQAASIHPFRYEKNVTTTSFMVPWWSVLSGKGVVAECSSRIIKVSDDTEGTCTDIINALESDTLLLCINEGKLQNPNVTWKEIRKVLETYFPEQSPFESAACVVTTN